MIPALLIGTDKYDIGQYFEFKLPEFKIAMRPEYAELIKSCLAPEPDDRPDAGQPPPHPP